MTELELEKIREYKCFDDKKIYSGVFADIEKSQKQILKRVRYGKPDTNKVKSLDYILDAVGLKDGMTISFHHSLRNGDAVMLYVIDAISKKGIKDLTLAASSLSKVQDCLLPYFEQGVITAIDTSGNRGKLGEYVQKGHLKKPAIYRTHGGRARAIECGELHIDVAFIAAPVCDIYGNINGVDGKSACGSLGYAISDSEYADYVVAITDTLSDIPLNYVSIPQTNVDYITMVDSVTSV